MPTEAAAPSDGPAVATAPAGARAKPLPRFLAPLVGFLRRHPIVALLLLTPGIPEYLSASSPLNLLFVHPAVFGLFFAANAAMYLPGALLIREAQIRWHQGGGTVICLGAAYAVAEEGIGLSTMFDPRAMVVGSLGSYGHYLGVNWVWIPGVMMFHIVFSISIPILLFGSAFPEYRGRSLVTRRGLAVALGVLALDLALLLLFVDVGLRFFMGPVLLAAALLALTGLVLLARRLPHDLLARVPTGRPAHPARLALLGAFLLPSTFLLEGLSIRWGIPPAAAVLAELALFAVMLGAALRWGVLASPDRPRLAFIAGALLPVALLGFLGSFPTTGVADVALGYFLLRLWRANPASPGGPSSLGPRPDRAAAAAPPA